MGIDSTIYSLRQSGLARVTARVHPTKALALSAWCHEQDERITRLTDELEEARGEADRFKADHIGACIMVAKMHAAAVGAVTGPNRGVVEDIEDLRRSRDGWEGSWRLSEQNRTDREADIKALESKLAAADHLRRSADTLLLFSDQVEGYPRYAIKEKYMKRLGEAAGLYQEARAASQAQEGGSNED